MPGHDLARQLLQSLADALAADELRADLCFDVAREIEHCGDVDTATGLMDHVRLHRAKAIELKARLAALMEQWDIQL